MSAHSRTSTYTSLYVLSFQNTRYTLHILVFAMQQLHILSRSSTPLLLRDNTEDQLARESDVTASTNVTLNAEYRGFFIYVLSSVFLVVFFAWALVPESVLKSCGIYYYPDKYWAQAIPAYLLMGLLFMYIFLALYNTEILTNPLDDVRLFTDEHAVYPEVPEDWIFKAPSGVWDMPIGLVNEVLYETDDSL